MATIYGTDASESLVGTEQNDYMYGYGGNDTLDGKAGADTMDGGDNNDAYMVDNVGDIVKEVYDDALGGTADTVFSSVSYSIAPGTLGNQGYGIENLTLTGSANINATGNSKNNTLTGNSGNNYLYGGAGADTLDGWTGNDYLNGGDGDDYMLGYDGNDTLDGWYGNDKLYGEAGNDSLLGYDGNDQLFGGAGTDTLKGEAGNDLLDGFGHTSYEYDEVYGGAGADIFVLGDSFGAHYQGAGYATIKDFNWAEGDKIQVFGSKSDYTLNDYGSSVDILYKGDLIGYVSNTNNVIASSDFIFV